MTPTTPALTSHPLSESPATAIALIPRCRTTRDADQVHARLVTTGVLREPFTVAHVVLSLCSSPQAPLRHLARRIFFGPSQPPATSSSGDPFLWNAFIKTSSHGPDPGGAVLTFSRMVAHGILPDRFSFSLVLKACSRAAFLGEGLQIHGLLMKSGLYSDLFLQNSLISFYCRCGSVGTARQMFDRMRKRDSISSNLIINGYSMMGMMPSAQEIFDQMAKDERSSVSWNSMICGYARLGRKGIDAARHLFAQMPARDSFSWNSMIDGLVKSGNVELARALFNEMPDKDLITWNIMISGYAKNGCFIEALSLFQEMPSRGKLLPDSTTLATALSAIAELGQINDGLSIHEYIQRNQLPLGGKLGVALIDMYSKCGRLEKALKIFEISGRRSVDHWNAMIGGLAVHGYGRLALHLFQEMGRHSLRPDDITFIEILNACSHSGLVEEGLAFFSAMEAEYNMTPKVQHYGCVVDILGRAGRLEEARRLIEAMPMGPNEVVWRSLLSACKNHGSVGIGQSAAKNLLQISSCDSSSYILLCNMYAGVRMWADACRIRAAMKEREIRKVPGCSWIELEDSVHEFLVGG
ncbi:unnamed protein product [Spirodela intermedia]|uniref:Uncharacterized protein n=1 Tax=Spirodela intermedia TaxID=51605 RepID=A0A7I8IHA0_SPIIN|nr:unnamed protein product [Spirodela intermedia]CAA6656232.1 unnamed protein product [Spirodela intermedia]